MAVGDPYLDPAEYEDYGLDPNIPDSVVASACRMINRYTKHLTSATVATTGVVNGLWSGSYIEIKNLKIDSNVIRLPYRPSTSITAMRGRQKRNRRSDPPDAYDPSMQYSGVSALTGIAPWITIDPAQAMLLQNGQCEVPYHYIYGKFAEVEVTYLAGYTVIPEHIKEATAKLARELPVDYLDMSMANVKSITESKHQLTRFDATFLTDDVKELLRNDIAKGLR